MEEHKAFIGGKEIKEFYVGNQELDEIWCGNVLFWKKNTVKDYFEFTYSGATSFSASGSISISVDDMEKWTGDYARMTSFSLPSGGTNVKIRGNLTDISFYGSYVISVLTPFPISMNAKTSFLDCFYRSRITSIPSNLFSNCPEVTSFEQCFMSCYYLSSIPGNLFENCPKVLTFRACFSGARITSIPSNLFSNCPEVTNFEHCFGVCENITSIPGNLFENCPKVTTFKYCVSRTRITSIPSNLFSNCPEVTSFEGCFNMCEKITSIPGNLFENCPKVTDFSSCFYFCEGLRSIPSNLFSNCPNVTSFERCFSMCGRYLSQSIMTGRAPELWITHPNADGKGCFHLTWGFDNDKDIPSYWKQAV